MVRLIENFSGPCEKLPEYFDPSLSVTETFPVATGTVLGVTLSCTDNELAVGDKTITCYGGSHFYYSKTPACLPQGKIRFDMQRIFSTDETYMKVVRTKFKTRGKASYFQATARNYTQFLHTVT